MATQAEPLDGAAHFLIYLHERWADEKEYEDWKEYIAAMTARLPAGVTDVTMTKRPFEVKFTLNGTRRFIRIKRGYVEWGTVK